MSDTWAPTVPNWSAVVPESITQVVMAYYGVQSKGESENGRACAAFQTILGASTVGVEDQGPVIAASNTTNTDRPIFIHECNQAVAAAKQR